MKIYREFVRACLRRDSRREPTDEELATSMNSVKPFSKHQAAALAPWLGNFAGVYGASSRKKRSQTAAAKRWNKKVMSNDNA
jgi:hypothetical protein